MKVRCSSVGRHKYLTRFHLSPFSTFCRDNYTYNERVWQVLGKDTCTVRHFKVRLLFIDSTSLKKAATKKLYHYFKANKVYNRSNKKDHTQTLFQSNVLLHCHHRILSSNAKPPILGVKYTPPLRRSLSLLHIASFPADILLHHNKNEWNVSLLFDSW